MIKIRSRDVKVQLCLSCCPLSWVLLVSCLNLSSQSREVGSRYYADINLFSLQGVKELDVSELQFPYIKIDSLGTNERIIEFRFDEQTTHATTYLREDSIWSSVRRINSDEEGSPTLFYEFVMPNAVVELEYNTDTSSKEIYLSKFQRLEANTIKAYAFEPGNVKCKPSPTVRTEILSKCISTESLVFERKNEILSVRSTRTNISLGKTEREETCYKMNGLSIFWWMALGHKLEKIEC